MGKEEDDGPEEVLSPLCKLPTASPGRLNVQSNSAQTLPLPFLSADVCVAPWPPNESAALKVKEGKKKQGKSWAFSAADGGNNDPSPKAAIRKPTHSLGADPKSPFPPSWQHLHAEHTQYTQYPQCPPQVPTGIPSHSSAILVPSKVVCSAKIRHAQKTSALLSRTSNRMKPSDLL